MLGLTRPLLVFTSLYTLTMSAHHQTPSPASAKTNQFIRPNTSSTHVDTASTAERLVLKGNSFTASNEVAAVMREGVAAELADAVMAALGSCFACLSDEDICILADLYTTAPSAAMTTADAVIEPEGPNTLAKQEHGTPHLPAEASGDKAAGSPAASIATVAREKGAISSPEDDLSMDESPSGGGHTITVDLPVDDPLPKWQMFG
jgi:hypothetical protein